MISTLRRLGGMLIYAPDNALGDGAPNLLSAPEFAGGLADAPVRGGLVTASTLAGYDGAIAFGRDGVQTSYALKNFTPTIGLTYSLTVVVQMDDGLAPTFSSSSHASAANSFVVVPFNVPVNPLTYQVAPLGGGFYAVSASATCPSVFISHGVYKYNNNDSRTFKVTGYKLEQGSVATPYTPQSVLRQRGVYVDNAGITPVTAVGDLFGLLLDRCGTVGPNIFTDAGVTFAGEASRVSPGVYRIYSSAGAYAAVAVLAVPAGKSFEVTFNVDSVTTAGGGLAVDPGSTPIPATVGPKRVVLVNVPTTIAIKRAGAAMDVQISNVIIKELTGNHATQSAVASKPSVQRVPKRTRGPVNQLLYSQWGGGGTAPTGWLAFGAGGTEGALLPSGMRQRVFTSTASRDFIYSLVNLAANTVYTVAVYVDANPNNAIASNILLQGSLPVGAGMVVADTVPAAGSFIVGTITTGANAGSATLHIGLGTSNVVTGSVTLSAPAIFQGTYTAQQIIDNGGIPLTTTTPLPNVLEWANAISFDGSNDYLQTGIGSGVEGWFVSGITVPNHTSNQTLIGNGAGNGAAKGVWMAKGTGESTYTLNLSDGSGGLRDALASATTPLNTPCVIEGGWNAATMMTGVNGVETAQAKTKNPTHTAGMQIGGLYSVYHNGPMHAIAYTPVLPSAADRATIRNGIAALQGRTL